MLDCLASNARVPNEALALFRRVMKERFATRGRNH
jgi:hypothetical protein